MWRAGESAPSRVGAREKDVECATTTPSDFRRFEAMLRSIDVVGVTERFDEFLLALKDVAGVRHVAYVKSNEGAKNRASTKSSSTSKSNSSPRSLNDVPESVADAIRSSTTMDTKAHELASRLMDERAERRFGGVAAAKREAEAFARRRGRRAARDTRVDFRRRVRTSGSPPPTPNASGRRASCPGVSRTRRAEDKPPRTSSSIRWCSWTRRRTRRASRDVPWTRRREPQPRGDEGGEEWGDEGWRSGAAARRAARRNGAPDRRAGSARELVVARPPRRGVCSY